MAEKSSLRALLPVAFRVVLSVLLLLFVATRIDFAEVWAQARDVSLPLAAVATIMLGFNLFWAAIRLQIILKAVKATIPLGKLLIIYVSSHFFTTFIPSGLGGDVYRGAKIYKRARAVGTSVFSVLLERAAALLSMFSLSLVGILIAAPYLEGRATTLAFLVGGIILFIVVVLLLSRHLGGLLRLIGRVIPPLKGLTSSFASLLESIKLASGFGVLVRVYAISLLTHFAMVLAVYILALALGEDVPFRFFLAFVPLITVFMMLPLTVGGLGLRELGYVYFFPQVGMTAEAAVQLSLLYMGSSIVLALLGGVVYLFFSGKVDEDVTPSPQGEAAG